MEKNWYDRWYKIMLLLPVILVIISLVYLFSFNRAHGDLLYRDTSLAGGTTITLQGDYNVEQIENSLGSEFPDLQVRSISDLTSGRHIATIISSSSEPEPLKVTLEELFEIQLTDQNSTIEFSGPTLGDNFYRQLGIALLFSFVLMSIVIFFLFRTFIPSIAVIFAAFANIIMALTAVNLMGIRLSAAGIAAFLMLVGYSVDTDILLTTRVLKKRGNSVNHRIYGAFKTGIFMTITALLAVLPAFFIVTGLPDSFRQIFLILALGLSADIINTWLTNASILKWYANKKGIQ